MESGDENLEFLPDCFLSVHLLSSILMMVGCRVEIDFLPLLMLVTFNAPFDCLDYLLLCSSIA